MSTVIPSIILNNGARMPVIGLGTYSSKSAEGELSIKTAIDFGYRHIDTAFLYQNEREVGNGIRAKIDEGVITREDMFVVTKLWSTFNEPQYVEIACRKSLENLGLDYIDLYLMHSPAGLEYRGFESEDFFPKDSEGKLSASNADYVDTWKEMEKLVRLGLVRNIGISNFNSEQITRLLTVAEIKPVTNQVECSANLNQHKLISFCRDLNIVITAYSPLGRSQQNSGLDGSQPALHDLRVQQIAQNHQKTPVQIILKYLIALGTIPIPKSTNPTRIAENINIFDFELTEDELAIMDTLNTGDRKVGFTEAINHKYYPFAIEF